MADSGVTPPILAEKFEAEWSDEERVKLELMLRKIAEGLSEIKKKLDDFETRLQAAGL